MSHYDDFAKAECRVWMTKMIRPPSFFNRVSKRWQNKVNSWIPEKVHQAITATIREMIRGVLFGARYTTAEPMIAHSLMARETVIKKRIELYRTTAAVEGGVTGAGGLLLGLADFPILLGLKMKLLFDIAALYGFDVDDYRERVYLLHIFEVAFSSHEHRRNVFLKMENWNEKKKSLPDDIRQFEWRSFQQEYRDYLDIAKMAQLVPVIGAPVGVIVNYGLIKKLGITAINSYRMRLL